MNRLRISLDMRLLLLVGGGMAVGSGVAALLLLAFDTPLLAAVGTPLLGLPLAVIAVRATLKPYHAHLNALSNALAALQSGDYSLNLAVVRDDALGELARAYNLSCEVLRRERLDRHQRELMLDTLMQSSPQAVLLIDERQRILYCNLAARNRFNHGKPLVGLKLEQVLNLAPAPLREAISGQRDGLCSLPGGAEAEVVHVSSHPFTLNSRQHRLIQLQALTREISRQELDTWKKLIRSISHELNNSLAPIASLAHSGQLLVERQQVERLPEVFATIEQRAGRLRDFLDAYARFAKMPRPRLHPVQLGPFFARLAATVQFTPCPPLPTGEFWLDPGQIEQVLINLIRNAREAGSSEASIELSARRHGDQLELSVCDRGPGMSDTVLQQALTPFYSTKSEGSGLGLTLCREIIDAHGGSLQLNNRSDGGLRVCILLPQHRYPPSSS